MILSGAEHRRQPFADRLKAIDLARVRRHGGRIERQRGLVGEGGDEGVPVGPRENFDRHGGAALLMIFEEERIRRDIRAGVVDKARASPPEHGGQSHPFGGHQRPRPHRDDDGIRLDDAAIDLNTPRRSIHPQRRTMPVTRPWRSSAPCSCAALIMAAVKARG